MAFRTGRCTNDLYCSFASSQQELQVPADGNFVCPQCGKPLSDQVARSGVSPGRIALLAGGALVLAGGGLFAAGLLMNGTHGAPAPQVPRLVVAQSAAPAPNPAPTPPPGPAPVPAPQQTATQTQAASAPPPAAPPSSNSPVQTAAVPPGAAPASAAAMMQAAPARAMPPPLQLATTGPAPVFKPLTSAPPVAAPVQAAPTAAATPARVAVQVPPVASQNTVVAQRAAAAEQARKAAAQEAAAQAAQTAAEAKRTRLAQQAEQHRLALAARAAATPAPSTATAPAAVPVVKLASNAAPAPTHNEEESGPSRGFSSRPLTGGSPSYPSELESDGRPGHVTVACRIEADGSPNGCRVVAERGGAPFRGAVLRWLNSGRVRYAPILHNGQPVAEVHSWSLDFQP